MATKLTGKQVAEILMQTPERITNGFLERRTLADKLRDRFMTYSHETGVVYVGGIRETVQNMRRKLLLEFEAACALEEEHPRSLRKAALELKALGFSNEQVWSLKEEAYQLSITHLYGDTPIKRDAVKTFPGLVFGWNDKAFLGTVAYNVADVSRPGFLTGSSLPEKAHNSAYSEASEVMALEILTERLERKRIQEPDLFSPRNSIKFSQMIPS